MSLRYKNRRKTPESSENTCKSQLAPLKSVFFNFKMSKTDFIIVQFHLFWLKNRRKRKGNQAHWKFGVSGPVFHCPAGIIDSADFQMKLNLNEWVCTDMNV